MNENQPSRETKTNLDYPSFAEDILPVDQQFEAVLGDSREEIMDILVDVQQAWNDVIDPDMELRMGVEKVMAISKVLAGNLCAAEDNLDEVTKAIYRGIVFGCQITNELKSNDLGLGRVDISLAFDGYEEERKVAEIFEEIVEKYSDKRPIISDFIRTFSCIIDKSKSDYVYLSAIFTLLLFERQQGRLYYDEMVGNLCVEAESLLGKDYPGNC